MNAISLLFAVGASFLALVQPSQQPASLRQTYERHIAAIAARDLPTLMATVTDKPQLHFIDSRGTLRRTRADFHKYHVEWFAQKGWKISFARQSLHQRGDHGYVMSIYTYEDITSEGQPYKAEGFVTLVFERRDGQWRMVADICTTIRK